MLKQASSACPPPSSPDAPVAVSPALLLKDACYNAIGVANYDLYDYVDFQPWSAHRAHHPLTLHSLLRPSCFPLPLHSVAADLTHVLHLFLCACAGIKGFWPLICPIAIPMGGY